MRSPEKEMDFIQRERMLVTKLDVVRKETIETSIAEGIRHSVKSMSLNNAGYAPLAHLKPQPMNR